jgi:guanylate kinase
MAESHDTTFRLALQDTTRAARPGEEHGRDYNFLHIQEFARNEASSHYEWLGVLERADGTKYGFRKSELKQANSDGIKKRIVSIFDIDVERALTMRSSAAGLVDPALLLLVPPSETCLRERLKTRADLTMTEDKLKQRLDYSKEQMVQGFQNFSAWDLIIVNDDLERTYAVFKKFLMKRFCIKEVRK